MTDLEALLFALTCLLGLSVIETALARLVERHRLGDRIFKGPQEQARSQMARFLRTVLISLGANLGLTAPVALSVYALGRGSVLHSVKEMVWGGPLTLALVVACVLLLVACASLTKGLLYARLRHEERWRAAFLGLMGGVAWTYIMAATMLLSARSAITLEEAVVANDLESARHLLGSGPPPSLQLEAAWHAVPFHADLKMAELLLQAGASLDSRSPEGHTVLEDAVLGKHEELALGLLERGAGVDGEVLPAAARAGMVGVVKQALKKGADPNRSNPLLACIGTRADAPRAAEIAATLLAAGADPNRAGPSPQGGPGETLSPLAWATSCRRPEVVELLLQHGARAEEVGQDQMTALHIALWLRYHDVARVLILHGAPLDRADRLGRKPRDMTRDPELVQLMKGR